MTFPDTLPWLIDYRVGETIRGTLPRRVVQTHGSSGATDAAIVCPQIPLGADAWRLPGGEWQKLYEMPHTWMPFVNRQRPGPMDPRATPKP